MNITTSAQLDIEPQHEAIASANDMPIFAPRPEPDLSPAPFALQQQVAERLAAHRLRRVRTSASPAAAGSPTVARPPRAARIAAAVAERYANSPSYSAFLAEEAERATRQAQAAAEVAHRNARAVAQAQQQLLDELDQWGLEPAGPTESVRSQLGNPPRGPSDQEISIGAIHPSPRSTSSAPAATHVAGLTIRLYQDLGRSHSPVPGSASALPRALPIDPEEARALDQEIAFRQAPVFEAPAEPSVPLPANLIEFPRQLIAARKSRPRLAEGPLREEADLTPASAQLRIFEVQASQISSTPDLESAVPEWSSIRLDAPAVVDHAVVLETLFSPTLAPQAAPLGLRFMAAIVDGSIVAAAVLSFAAAFALITLKLSGEQIPLRIGLAGIALATPLLALLFFMLFFSFAEATPGMRYARIGLCTFSDENPSRAAMRRRLLAILIAACPLGIGLLWAWLDDDRLGWHDRISRMYQRSY